MLDTFKKLFRCYMDWRQRNTAGVSLNRKMGYQGGFVSWIPAIASIGSALIGASASKSAANTQAAATDNAAQAQLNEFNTINQQQAPWRQAGGTAVGQMANLTSLPSSDPASMTHQFTTADLNANLAPNYDFMLGQGIGATKNQLNSTGGLVSGNALQGVNTFAQNYAQNAYQQAFNNYNSNQTNIYNRLSNLAGLGQTANQSTANAGQAAVGASSNYLTSGAAAQAAGTVGVANAINGGAQNALGWNYLNSLNQSSSGVVPVQQAAAPVSSLDTAYQG